MVTSETVSATAIRRCALLREPSKQRRKSERRKNARDDSDDDVEDDDIERMNEDKLSNFNPLVLMRRAHEETRRRTSTPLEAKLASIRRFKPAAPVTGTEDPNGRNLWHRACLYLGASAAIRRKRRTHDAERIRRAREVLDLLLDAALGGRGDQLGSARIAGDGRRGAKRPAFSLGDACEVPAGGDGGGGRGDDSGGRGGGDETRPAELPRTAPPRLSTPFQNLSSGRAAAPR